MRVVLPVSMLAFGALSMPTGAQEAYTLSPGDVLQLWVSQDEQLNRSVTVGPDGRVSLPLVGHLTAQNKTVEALEGEVAARLRPFYADNLNLTLMLQPHAAHMPSVFVAGEVSDPGVFPYRPHMTVLHAMTLAGGPFRGTLAASDLDRSIVLQSEIEAAEKTGGELTLTIARLQAELDGSSELTLPPDPTFRIADAERTELQRREQAMLDLRMAERESQQEFSGQLKVAGQRNAEAIRQQRSTVDRRLELAKARLQSTTTLVERGHMQRTQLLEQEGEIAALEGMASQLEAELAEAEADMINEDNRSEAAARDRRIELVGELNEAQQRLEALNARLIDNRRALLVYARESAREAVEAPMSYRILRTVDGDVKEIEATRSTILQPGDLVEVVKGGAASPPAAQSN